MNIRRLKKIASKHKKSISRNAIKLILKNLSEISERLIKKSARKADFFGRKTIKEKDVHDVLESEKPKEWENWEI